VVGKSRHPLSDFLYLKHIEGVTLYGKPVHPRTVSARTHEITRNPAFVSMEANAMDREPKSGMPVASDPVAALYAAYVSAEREG
jgi:hypothetical protein